MTTYTITLTDGTVLTTLVSQQIDTTHTSLTLWGQGAADYGQYLHDDLVHLLENAADTTAPTVPLTGQLWYDSGYQLYRSWNGTAWIPMRPDALPNDAGAPTLLVGSNPSIVALMSSGIVVAAASYEAVSFGSLPASISYRNTSYSFQSKFPNGLAAGITLAHSLEPALDDDSDTLVTSSWVQQQSYLSSNANSLTANLAVPVNNLGTVATSSLTINTTNNRVNTLTLATNLTSLTLELSLSGVLYVVVLLVISQDSTGSRTVTWPDNVQWQGGTPPTLSTIPGAVDVIQLMTFNTGSTWYGSLVLEVP